MLSRLCQFNGLHFVYCIIIVIIIITVIVVFL